LEPSRPAGNAHGRDRGINHRGRARQGSVPMTIVDKAKGAKSAVTHGATAAKEAVVGLASHEPMTPEQIAKHEDYKNRAVIITGLTMGRIVWKGDFCRDLVFYIKQTHVLIGMFCCHKLHPFTRVDRFIVWLEAICAGFGLSLLMVEDFRGETRKDLVGRSFALSVSICLSIMNVIVAQAATCRWVQAGTPIYDLCGRWGKCIGQKAGQVIVLQGMVISLLILVAGLSRATYIDVGKDGWRNIRYTFAVAQVYSWIFGVFICIGFYMLLYCGLGRWNCCCAFCVGSGQVGSNYKPDWMYPYGPEYPTDYEMMWKNDRCSYYDETEAAKHAAKRQAAAPPSQEAMDAMVLGGHL